MLLKLGKPYYLKPREKCPPNVLYIDLSMEKYFGGQLTVTPKNYDASDRTYQVEERLGTGSQFWIEEDWAIIPEKKPKPPKSNIRLIRR